MIIRHVSLFKFFWSILFCLALLIVKPVAANPAKDINKRKKEQAAKQAVIANPQSIPPFEPPFLPAPPVIDGVLDDAAWKSEPLALSEWITYNPAYGEIMAGAQLRRWLNTQAYILSDQ
jgi:hypothetical protein